MCEIAIVDTDELPGGVEQCARIANRLYQTQRSSLGVVAVYHNGDTFEYSIFKHVDPEYNEIKQFVEESAPCYRFIIHGRLATCGEVCERNAHPIAIDCDECNVDYVIHNGIVSRHRLLKERLKDNGHDFNTEVDSEVIAHVLGDVPDYDDEAETFNISSDKMRDVGHQPAFILLNESAIYISGPSYELSADVVMARTNRSYAPANGRLAELQVEA